ncbi:hypothetical protein M1843_15505 [Isoptericola sp. 4D.3]|uniref:Uncharacterized protein n=1 Tax=Isoptericola peretonis TaxID=2918523 RepID=A0ABT0J6P8_9MICO|nr:hypothetical protein [Isoptericola sp. 4D.3]
MSASPTATPSAKGSWSTAGATPSVAGTPSAGTVSLAGADRLGADGADAGWITRGETSTNRRPSALCTTPIFSTSTGMVGWRRKSTALRISSLASWQMMMSRALLRPGWERVMGTLS